MIETVVESPLTLKIVGWGTSSLGLAVYLEAVRGFFTWAAMVAGLVATGMLIMLQWAKFKNERLQNKIFRDELAKRGIKVED